MCLLTATENPTTIKADTSTVKENWYYFIIVGAGIFIICILAFVAYHNCPKEKEVTEGGHKHAAKFTVLKNS